jgi:hypothetical protein
MKGNWPQNLLLVAFLGIVPLFTACQEYFLPIIGAFYWLVLILIFVIAIDQPCQTILFNHHGRELTDLSSGVANIF